MGSKFKEFQTGLAAIKKPAPVPGTGFLGICFSLLGQFSNGAIETSLISGGLVFVDQAFTASFIKGADSHFECTGGTGFIATSNGALYLFNSSTHA